MPSAHQILLQLATYVVFQARPQFKVTRKISAELETNPATVKHIAQDLDA
jgi:hypothetical protein